MTARRHYASPIGGAMHRKSMKNPAVYIMTNKRNGTLYTGVTSDLPKRAYEHREGLAPGFTKRYGCKTLVWYEVHDTMAAAIGREKQLKAGPRHVKLALIETRNPEWRDLFEELM
jgi:putative endonuclease